MAIVSRFSVEWAKSVKKAAKQRLTQHIHQMVGISDDSGSISESEDSENETGLTGAGENKHKHREDTTSDGSVDQDVILRGNPTTENGQDGDHSDSEASESDVVKRRFRFCRKKDGKQRRKTRFRKRVEREDVEMGEVSQYKDKIGGVGFGLSSKEQITPEDAVLVQENVNEVGPVLFDSRLHRTLTWCLVFADCGSCDHASGNHHP
jgi:hypothetical protein